FASYDFETWTQASCLSFRRDAIPPHPMPTDWNIGEEVHLGAGLWDRGNVIVAFYGMYHNETNDRLFATMDLGLLVSHDAMHFREPVPDFKIVRCFEERHLENPSFGAGTRLLQAGYANIGAAYNCTNAFNRPTHL
ncbi:MAG: hypothetical protein QGI09_11860, partial [Dehalococcoidia bacterium]|nr:hypothetical protein [Dehalococcoidia bacterium]